MAPSDIQTFWNNRSRLTPECVGTRDLLAKRIEMKAISKYARDGMRVLEVGCGNGLMAFYLTQKFRVDVLAIDFAEELIIAARSLLENQTTKGKVKFQVDDVRKLSGMNEKFDLIYTERVLINLSDWDSQKQAIADITQHLRPGGRYVMCENSQDGLDKINSLRERIGLSKITTPWHNRYLRDDELTSAHFPGIKLEKVIFYSSTYYFLSRVVNAWLAARQGKEPDYDAPVNQLALLLPSLGTLGQGRIWLWRKIEEKS